MKTFGNFRDSSENPRKHSGDRQSGKSLQPSTIDDLILPNRSRTTNYSTRHPPAPAEAE